MPGFPPLQPCLSPQNHPGVPQVRRMDPTSLARPHPSPQRAPRLPPPKLCVRRAKHCGNGLINSESSDLSPACQGSQQQALTFSVPRVHFASLIIIDAFAPRSFGWETGCERVRWPLALPNTWELGACQGAPVPAAAGSRACPEPGWQCRCSSAGQGTGITPCALPQAAGEAVLGWQPGQRSSEMCDGL